MSPKTTIQVDDEIDRWKWVCPRGHRDWEPTNHHFWCAACARAADDDVMPEFDSLHNKQSGETVHRDELQLLDEIGPLGDSI
ncbi:hypothetical protein ACLI4Z_16475 [Natrialbaceae archaeon A-arb3/5]